jgi:hypothetical protein
MDMVFKPLLTEISTKAFTNMESPTDKESTYGLTVPNIVDLLKQE